MKAKQWPCVRCLLSAAHDVPYSCRQDAQQPARASTRIKDLEVKVLSKREAEYAAVMQVVATPTWQLAALPHTCLLNVA